MVNIEYLLGKGNFDNFLLQNKTEIILLLFSASWCGPCQMLKQYLTSPEADIVFPGLKVVYFDVDNDENEELCTFFKVESLPTYVFSYSHNANNLRSIHTGVGFNFDEM